MRKPDGAAGTVATETSPTTVRATTGGTPMLDAALDYAERGMPLVPMWHVADGRCGCCAPNCERPGKHPIGSIAPHGCKSATTDLAIIRAWLTRFPLANIATATEGYRTVLDVDVRHGGDQTLAALEAQHGTLPKTLKVLTPQGGYHLHFAWTPLQSSNGRVGPGLDIKACGGLVNLPPSVGLAGSYREDPDHGLGTPLAEMPAWLIALAAAPASTGNGAAPHSPDDWATKLMGAPRGQRREIALEIAGHYLGLLGPTHAQEVEQILVGYAARCTPPFPEREARDLVRDLARRDRLHGTTRAAQGGGGAPVTDSAGAPASKPSPTIEWLIEAPTEWATLPPAECIVAGLIPTRTTTILAGDPKVGKSLLMLYICLAIAQGRPDAAGHFAIARRPKILYLAFEDGRRRIYDRRADILAAWGIGPEAESPGLWFMSLPRGFNLMEPAHVEWLRVACRDHDVEMVVLDTWTRSSSANPLDAEDQRALMEVVTDLRESLGATVVIVDHTRKNRADDRGIAISGADVFGPMQKWAAADQVIVLARSKRDEDVVTDGGGDGRTAGLSLGTRTEVFVEGRDVESVRFFLNRSQRGCGVEKFTYGGSVGSMAEAAQQKAATRSQAFANAALALHGKLGRPVTIKEIRAEVAKPDYGAIVISARAAQGYIADLVDGPRPQFRRIGRGKKSVYEPVGDSRNTPSLRERGQTGGNLFDGS